MTTEIRHGIVIRCIIPESNRSNVDNIIAALKANSVPGYFELHYQSMTSVEDEKKDEQ
jgi:hypothetical protein